MSGSDVNVDQYLQPEYWRSLECMNHHSEGECLSRIELSEFQVIREIILVLIGSDKSLLFTIRNHPDQLLENESICNPSCRLSHLSVAAFDNLLQQFETFLNNLSLIKVFVGHVFTSNVTHNQCIVEFANSLNNFLQQFSHLTHILDLKSRESTVFTLLQLRNCLLPWMRRVGMLAGIIMRVTCGYLNRLVEPCMHIQLLDTLFHICSTFLICTDDQEMIRLLQSLFFMSIEPYIKTLAKLMTGRLSTLDYLNEFDSEKGINVCVDDPRFFDNDSSHINFDSESKLPIFLKTVSGQYIDCLKGLSFQNVLRCRPITLPNHIMTNLSAILTTLQAHNTNSSSVVSHQCQFKTVTTSQIDSLMDEMVQSVFPETDPPQTIEPNVECDPDGVTHFVNDLHNLIRSTLVFINTSLITDLLSVKHPRTIGTTLCCIGAVYLFGAGDRMQDFARQLFSSIRNSGHLANNLQQLTLDLQDQFSFRNIEWDPCASLSFLSEHIVDFVFTNPDTGYSKQQETLSIFDHLNLSCKVEWPVSILIDERATLLYNHIFTFMLKLKYVKWKVEHLHFDSLKCFSYSSENNLSTISAPIGHRFCILRMMMLSLLSTLHDFFAHHIEAFRISFLREWHLPDIVGGGNTDSKQYSKTELVETNIGKLLASHTAFLSKLESFCLLNDSSKLLHHEFEELNRLGLRLTRLWSTLDNDVDIQSCWSVFLQLDDEFACHVKFLSDILTRTSTFHPKESQLSLLVDTFTSLAQLF